MVYKSGGDYDSHHLQYIEKLRDGINNNTTIKHDIFCLTDVDISCVEGVTAIPFQESFQRWHSRNCLFYPKQFESYDRVFYVDLDTIIVNNIDDILADESELMLHKDIMQPSKQLQYGCFLFNPNAEYIKSGEMYNYVIKQNLQPTHSSARVFNNFFESKGIKATIAQDKYKMCSYKLDIVQRKRNANDYQIVHYHGKPRPHETNWSIGPIKSTLTARQIFREKQLQRKMINKPTVTKERLEFLERQRQRQKEKKPPVTYSDITKCYDGEDVFVIGGGPSLKYVNLDKFLMDKNVIGVNDAYEFKCCKMLFFADNRWYKAHKGNVELLDYPVYSQQIHSKTVKKLCSSTKTFEPEQRNKIIWNGNSGDAAICIALLTGAKRVFLLGFDRKLVESTDGNPSNWHVNLTKVSKSAYLTMNNKSHMLHKHIGEKFPDVEIINVEINENSSALTLYPKIYFNEIFEVEKNEIFIDKEQWDLTHDIIRKKTEVK
jgi:uncharacterized Rossmann fold enzyme